LTSKVGRSDLVIGVQSGLMSRSLHARLQVSVQLLRYMPPWLTPRHTNTQTDNILTSLYEETIHVHISQHNNR